MALEKPQKCVGDCNGFVCLIIYVASEANKLVAICDSCFTHSEGCAKREGEILNSFILVPARDKKRYRAVLKSADI